MVGATRGAATQAKLPERNMVTLTTVDFHGWRNTQVLANDSAELVIPLEVGPRVLSYRLKNGPNVFFCRVEDMGRTGGNEFRAYGGHRLWHAPEALARTYTRDNRPVAFTQLPQGVRLTMAADELAGVEKEIDVALAEEGPLVTIVHRLTNRTPWPVELAAWAITQVAPGGLQIAPLPPHAPHGPEHLLPAHTFSLWSYSNLADPRWRLGARYVALRQDPSAEGAQKLGMRIAAGWSAYAYRDHLFVKRFAWAPEAKYPDHGVNYETFTNSDMLELESLGPLCVLEPGATVRHVERWSLFAGVPEPHSDDDIDRDVLPLALSVPPVDAAF